MLELIDLSNGVVWMKAAIRGSLIAVLWRLLYRTWQPRGSGVPPSLADVVLWSVGYALYVVHATLAFEYVHDWSHHRAWQQTADETARVTGIRNGSGIWINYALVLFWGLDSIRLATAWLRTFPTSKRVDTLAVFGIGFLWVNATAVFGPPAYRWLLIPFLVSVAVAMRLRRAEKDNDDVQSSRPVR